MYSFRNRPTGTCAACRAVVTRQDAVTDGTSTFHALCLRRRRAAEDAQWDRHYALRRRELNEAQRRYEAQRAHNQRVFERLLDDDPPEAA